MLMLILLILLGVGVMVLSVAVLRSRQATEAQKVRDRDSEGGEREVYERLYGKRSTTVSVVERPPEAVADSPQAGLSE